MSITPQDFRNGLVFERDGRLFKVVEFQHIKPGKGPAFVRTKLQDLKSGSIFEEKLRPEEKLEEVRIESRKMDYLYMDGDMLVVMDRETYDQIHLPKEILGRQFQLLTENEELTVAMNGETPMGAALPLIVTREVTYCEPGVRGDTATAANKPATVEGGATINVPLFVDTGDRIRINTESFTYVERAKD
ncbi:elongation factor P [bacterium]|nr:elongation factor P [bacterium]